MNETLDPTNLPQSDKSLDTSGLICPEPVMLLHKAVRDARSGQIIEVIATDPSTLRDIPKFCQFLSHELVGQLESEGRFLFYIRKG